MIISRNISDGGFDLSLAGALTGIGPLDALITFTEALKFVDHNLRPHLYIINLGYDQCQLEGSKNSADHFTTE